MKLALAELECAELLYLHMDENNYTHSAYGIHKKGTERPGIASLLFLLLLLFACFGRITIYLLQNKAN